jgi:Phage protein D
VVFHRLKKVAVSTGSGKTSYTLRHTNNDEESAIAAAKAKQNKLDKGATTVEVTLAVGNANLFAESPMTLIGFRSGIDGSQWTATKVEHDFSASGFTTRIEGETSN